MSGEMVWKITPSSAVRADDLFLFFINDRSVLTRTVEDLRKNPVVRVPFPPGLSWERFLHARVEARLSITDDVCRDMISGRLFWVVQPDSAVLFGDARIPLRSVSDFFETLFSELRIVLPVRPTLDEGRAGVWLSALLRKAVPGLSVSLESGFDEKTDSAPFILIAGSPESVPQGVEARGGISLVGERGLLLLSGVDGANPLADIVKMIASYPLFAAIPSGRFVPDGAAPSQGAEANFLPLVEGKGRSTVLLEIPVYPGLLPSLPQDLTFDLEGAYSLPRDSSRPARLDAYWNGIFLESKTLPAKGRFTERLLLPAEIPIMTENRLRLAVSYYVDEGMCRYKSVENRATLFPFSSVHGHGSFPLQRLSWNSFGVFALRKGLLLLDESLSVDILRAAADMLSWLASSYPEGIFLFPEVRATNDDPARIKSADWLLAVASPDSIPRELHELLPLNIHTGFLLEDRNGSKAAYSFQREEDVALLLLGNSPKPAILLSSAAPGMMSRASSFITAPKNTARLTGNVIAFRAPDDVRSYDTRNPAVSVKHGALLSLAERFWFRYRTLVIVGAWVLATVFFAGLFLKKRRSE